jgi:NADPH:quinone reductase-like Zn-dependent oxidoreductase
MQALRFDEFEFGSFDSVRLQTLPDPQPKSDELAVRIRAAALNPSDAKNILGRMEGTTLPRTPGRDFAGVVITGPSQMIGAEVWGAGGDVGFTRDGAYAELLLVPVDGVRPKPKNLSFEEAAAAGTTFVTAFIGLIETAHFQSGETVLVTGAAGGVGSAVTQIAKWKDGRTIGVGRSPMSPHLQTEFGVDHFLISDPAENHKSMVNGARQITGGKGANVAFDCVGGPLFEPSLRALGQLGRQVNITSVGSPSQLRPARFLPPPTQPVRRRLPQLQYCGLRDNPGATRARLRIARPQAHSHRNAFHSERCGSGIHSGERRLSSRQSRFHFLRISIATRSQETFLLASASTL